MPTFKITVDSSIRKIVVYNEKRTALAIRHVSGEAVYLSEDPTMVVEQGFPLEPGDGIVFRRVDGDTPEKALYGCTRTGMAELRIWEIYGEQKE